MMESLIQGILSNTVVVTALAALIALLSRGSRRPALIHSLCLLAIFKLVTPPLVPLSVPLPSFLRLSATSVAEANEFDFDPERELEAAGVLAYLNGDDPSRSRDDRMGEARFAPSMISVACRWESIVLGVMGLGTLTWWTLAAGRIVRFHRVLRDVEPMSMDWQGRILELADLLNLRRPPVVCMVPGDVPPMLWAVGVCPRLLLPTQLWAALDEDQRTALVLHELAHLKRRDHWVRWIELVIAGLYWWHPAVWWLRRTLREAEEQCCDAWVVSAMPRGARTYATALVAAVEYVSGACQVPAVTAITASATIGNGHVSSLKRRLRMIVRAKTPKRLSIAGRLVVLGLAALLLPLAPSWAQNDKTELSAAEPNQSPNKVVVRLKIAELKEDGKGTFTQKADLEPPATLVNPELARALRTQEIFKVKVSQAKDDEKDQPTSKEKGKDDPGRSTAERIEKQLKELVEKLDKDASPVGEEVRKALERSVREIHGALEKKGLTADQLRQAVERSREELRKSFEPGGPVQKEMREATERARKELHEAMERGRQEAERLRDEMHKQMEGMREQARRQTDEAREARKRAVVRDREPTRGRANPVPKPEPKPEVGEKSNREELDAARKQIRDLQQQLESATRRLNDLQQREPRGGEPPARFGEPTRRSERQGRNLGGGGGGGGRSVGGGGGGTGPSGLSGLSGTPEKPRANVQPGPARDDSDRRFRDLEEKMNRLLKELEELKAKKTSPDRTPAASNTRSS